METLTWLLIAAVALGGTLKVGSRHISDKKERERLEGSEVAVIYLGRCMS